MEKPTSPPISALIDPSTRSESAARALKKKAIRLLGRDLETDFRAAASEAVEEARSRGVPIAVLGDDGKVVRIVLKASNRQLSRPPLVLPAVPSDAGSIGPIVLVIERPGHGSDELTRGKAKANSGKTGA